MGQRFFDSNFAISAGAAVLLADRLERHVLDVLRHPLHEPKDGGALFSGHNRWTDALMFPGPFGLAVRKQGLLLDPDRDDYLLPDDPEDSSFSPKEADSEEERQDDEDDEFTEAWHYHDSEEDRLVFLSQQQHQRSSWNALHRAMFNFHHWWTMREESYPQYEDAESELSRLMHSALLLERDCVTGRTPLMLLWADHAATKDYFNDVLRPYTEQALRLGVGINDTDNRGLSLMDLYLLNVPCSPSSLPQRYFSVDWLWAPLHFLIQHGARVEARHVRLVPDLALQIDCSALLQADARLVGEGSIALAGKYGALGVTWTQPELLPTFEPDMRRVDNATLSVAEAKALLQLAGHPPDAFSKDSAETIAHIFEHGLYHAERALTQTMASLWTMDMTRICLARDVRHLEGLIGPLHLRPY